MYVCIFLPTYTCMYILIYICVCMFILTYTYTYVFSYINIYVCISVRIYIRDDKMATMHLCARFSSSWGVRSICFASGPVREEQGHIASRPPLLMSEVSPFSSWGHSREDPPVREVTLQADPEVREGYGIANHPPRWGVRVLPSSSCVVRLFICEWTLHFVRSLREQTLQIMMRKFTLRADPPVREEWGNATHPPLDLPAVSTLIQSSCFFGKTQCACHD